MNKRSQKILIGIGLLAAYQTPVHAQVNHIAATTTVIRTDTTKGGGGRGCASGNIPVSTMASSMNIPASNTIPNNTPNQAATTTTVSSGTVSQPASLEELTRQVAGLQEQLNSLQSKLPYQNMAVMVIEANERNMELKYGDDGSPYYLHQIRIDNPLCNSNPKAIVIVMNLGDKDHMQLANAFYQPKDQFWYISTPQLKLRGYDPVILAGIQYGDLKHPDYIFDPTPYSANSQGLAKVGPEYPKTGQRFSVLIFNELPNYNPALNHLENR